MSSWERARFIPWSKIPYGHAQDLGMDKERIQRQLQREADKQERELQEASRALKGGESIPSLHNNQEQNSSFGVFDSSIKFKWLDLFKHAAFGGTIGAITGSVFGFMDGMRTAQQSDVLKNASNVAKGRYLMQGTSRSAAMFGGFFGGFHVLRYGVRVAADPGEWVEIGLAGAVSLGAVMSQPALRPSLPYASMLIFMDCVHIVMRQFND
mmetsp:Transcript_95786/g.265979  ORF Transcript_95786/g.265979 Transcript_95786/m.265979 type:complete len:210 (-) Transcript_95786:36-665(-)